MHIPTVSYASGAQTVTSPMSGHFLVEYCNPDDPDMPYSGGVAADSPADLARKVHERARKNGWTVVGATFAGHPVPGIAAPGEAISDDALRVAEQARALHWAVCSSGDAAINHGDSPVYLAGRAAFITAIQVAYPALDPLHVYGIWLDCTESVQHCARYVAERADADTLDQVWSDISDVERTMVGLAFTHA